MVKHVNLRPTNPEDSLRRLLHRVENTSTVPHGVKVATASEASVYTTSAGDQLRWDGDTLASYDSRISDAKATADEAAADLEQASTDLVAARDRIAAVEAATTPEQLGTTAAEQINTRRLIVGRDAILTGTVDVAQLNVTESMSAEIVKAMTTESKRLIVTEDAILQRATVIENLVTPQLIAKKVDVQDLGAKLITSGSIQTDTAANRGVKINSAGINAWDESGVQTLRINGKDNLMVGTFSTAPQWDTGAKLVQNGDVSTLHLYSKINANSSYVPHGSVWFNSPDGNIGYTNMSVGATLYDDIRPDDPRIRLYPLQKSINFESKFTHGSAMVFGWGGVANLTAKGFTDMTFKFRTPLTGTNAKIGVFIAPEGKNPREMAWTTTNVTTTGFDLRLVNLTTLESGPVIVRYMAIAYDAT